MHSGVFGVMCSKIKHLMLYPDEKMTAAIKNKNVTGIGTKMFL